MNIENQTTYFESQQNNVESFIQRGMLRPFFEFLDQINAQSW